MPIVRQVALDNVPLRNGLVKDLCSYFLQWKLIIIIQIEWLILLIEDYGILYKPPKWPVLYDKCIGKSMVVCNLWERPVVQATPGGKNERNWPTLNAEYQDGLNNYLFLSLRFITYRAVGLTTVLTPCYMFILAMFIDDVYPIAKS